MLQLTTPPAVGLLVCALALSSVAAYWDWRTGHIPNWLTLGGVAFGLVAHGVLGAQAGGSSGAVAGSVRAGLGVMGAAAVPLVLFRCGGIGGGDVKLLAAMGALCGAATGVEMQAYAFSIAALYASLRLTYHGLLLRTVRSSLTLLVSAVVPSQRRAAGEFVSEIRFGPAVFAGACVALLLRVGSP